MNVKEGTSWKEFDDFVRYRQSSFRKQEAKRQELLQKKVAEEFARSNSRLFPNSPKSGKADSRPASSAKLRFTNPFRKYRPPPTKPKNGILKSAGKKRTKDLRQNVNPARRSYHDDNKQSFFPEKYFTVETPEHGNKPRSNALPPLKNVPKPSTRKTTGKYHEDPIKKADLTFYDKPVKQFPVDVREKDSKPRTKYPSPVPSPPPSPPPIIGYRESPRPKKPASPRKRDGTSPTSPQPLYNNERYNRIHPRLEDTYNLSPRPRRTPEVIERRRSPSNLSRGSRSPPTTQRARDEFTPMNVSRAPSPKEVPLAPSTSRQNGDDIHLPNLKTQKRAYLLSGVDGPSLGTRPSRTYHFNPGTTIDDRDFKTVIPAAGSPEPTRGSPINGRRRRQRDEDLDSDEDSSDSSTPNDEDRRRPSRHKTKEANTTDHTGLSQQGGGGFRYKRDLNTKSRVVDQETERLPPVNQQPRPSNRERRGGDDDDDDSQTNSLSTTHLSDLGDIPAPPSKVRGHRPVQTAFDRSPTRMSSIHEDDNNSLQSIDGTAVKVYGLLIIVKQCVIYDIIAIVIRNIMMLLIATANHSQKIV